MHALPQQVDIIISKNEVLNATQQRMQYFKMALFFSSFYVAP